MTVDLSADVAVDLSADVAELTVDDALLAKLGRDELNIIWRHLSPDDHLAAALTCKAFNSLRPKRRKFPWVAEDLDGKNPMVTEKMKTRLLSTMRSPTLQEWAAALGAPSIYPHWVEIHSLKGAPQYNGRVGRALGPPNESGRLAVEVDAGLGELPRRGSHSTPSLKSILVKAENISTLTCLDSELVYACHAEGGGGIGSSWTSVLLPRQHSCFYREEHASEFLEGRGNRTGMPIESVNQMMWQMAGKTQDRMSQTEGSMVMGMVTDRGTIRSPPYKPAATKTLHVTPDAAMPLDHAAWARVQRSPVLAVCGVRLAIQRVEHPNSRDRKSMQNQLATFLMIDTKSGFTPGFAPPHWQDGIGDTFIYKAPGASDGMGNLEHLDMDELGFMWDYINGELGCGEFVDEASDAAYRKGLARYRKQSTSRDDDSERDDEESSADEEDS